MNYKQKGGLLLPYKDQKKSQEIFSEFLGNAKSIELVSKGSYGLTFKVNLSREIPSEFINKDYKEIRPDANFGKPVTSILVKLCFIYDAKLAKKRYIEMEDENEEQVKTYDFEGEYNLGTYGRENITLNSVSPSDFQNEINIQTDIYLKTIQYLQPLCPGIVYANVLDSTNGILLLNRIKDKVFPELKNLIVHIQRVLNFNKDIHDRSKEVGLGVIGMQFVENSATLLKYENVVFKGNPEAQNVVSNMGRYALLRLALDTGYNHNDFHKSNIMVEENDRYFYELEEGQHDYDNSLVEGYKQRAVIIDFGRATKIPPEIMELIKDAVSKRNYMQALKYLCDNRTGNQFISDRRYYNNYGWICGNYNTSIIGEQDSDDNSIISELINLRESAINENTYIMDQLHGTDPAKYPLLPVPNSFKNQLYEGMLGGRRKRKTRRRVKKTKKSKKHRKSNI